jgi:formylglycine-generating enzyme required for sulfatase activity
VKIKVTWVATLIGTALSVTACIALWILLKPLIHRALVGEPEPQPEVHLPAIVTPETARPVEVARPAPKVEPPKPEPPKPQRAKAPTGARPGLLDCTGPDGATAADIDRVRAAWAKYLGVPVEEAVNGDATMRFILLPPGKFIMGSPTGEGAREANEVQHEVTLSKPFFLGIHDVTRGQFRRFVEETGYVTDAESDHRGSNRLDPVTGAWKNDPGLTWRSPSFPQADDHPVVMVSWNDAIKYAEWLSQKHGRSYRLPTEAEWEYACRAGTRTKFYFGDDGNAMVRFGNAADASFRKVTVKKWGAKADDGYGFTAPVGHFQPNAFGLYDMHGNVWQWCADQIGDYATGSVTDPMLTSGNGGRVLRGGSWYSDPPIARAAHRYWYGQSDRLCDAGFRLAEDPPSGQ